MSSKKLKNKKNGPKSYKDIAKSLAYNDNSYKINKHKPQKKKSKAHLRTHSIRRFKERFDTELTNTEYDNLIEIIKTRRTKCLFKESNSRYFFYIEVYGNIPCVAVYNTKIAAIATFITMDMYEEKIKYYKLKPLSTTYYDSKGAVIRYQYHTFI